jgi:hypothetical protein
MFNIISGVVKLPFSSSKQGIKLSGIISETVLLHPPEKTANLSPTFTFTKYFILTVILLIASLLVDFTH